MKLYTLDMNSLLDVSYASIKLFFLKKGKILLKFYICSPPTSNLAVDGKALPPLGKEQVKQAASLGSCSHLTLAVSVAGLAPFNSAATCQVRAVIS